MQIVLPHISLSASFEIRLSSGPAGTYIHKHIYTQTYRLASGRVG